MKSTTTTYSAEQSQYIVARACHDGRLSDRIIRAYLDELASEISTIEARLVQLRQLAGGKARKPVVNSPIAAGTRSSSRVTTRRRAPRTRVTAKNKASQQIQGRYIAYLRQVPEKDRGQFQEIVKAKGREAAIAAMRKALGS
jgi:predicted metal-dependent hydrolase